jgi:hypothetical protein
MNIDSQLTEAGPSRWVVRRHKTWIISNHATAKEAARSLAERYPHVAMRDLLNSGIEVTQSYTATVRYWDRSHQPERAFPTEFEAERPTFSAAMDALAGWLHVAWEQDRANHPSTAGRTMAFNRWNNILQLANIAGLTLLRNPGFRYAFGNESPPEGRGHDLRILVGPTPELLLSAMEGTHV